MRPNEGTAAGETQIFIGRADERARLDALVEARRIVAVVGASGVGKSALIRACLPHARVVSFAGVSDGGGLDARIAGGRAAAVVVWDDVPEALAGEIARRAAAWSEGVLVVASRVPLAALPTIELGPLAHADALELASALDARDPLLARAAAGGHPAQIARRLWAARHAIGGGGEPEDALAALCAGRFDEALDGDPIVAAAALCGLDALDRAAALVHAHADHPRAPLVATALAWRRGELRECAERGERLLAALDAAGDALGHAIAAAIVARAAFGLGEVARAEALLRAVDGFVAAGGAPALAPLAELGRMLIAAFRGDWDEARRRAGRAHAAAPSSTLCAVERAWAAGAAPPPALDGAARALLDLRAAERALGDGRLAEANVHARDAERFWRDAGAAYDRTLALLARTEAASRAGDRRLAAKLRQACATLADGGGYRIAATALALLDAHAADRDGDLAAYVASLARARALAGVELGGRALADACARVGLSSAASVADGQPMRDRVARLGLGRAADRLCARGRALWLLADDEALPDADAVVDVDEGTITAGGREQPMAPQLVALLDAIAEAGGDGVTPEALWLAVWQGGHDYHPLRHRNAVYVAVNRLRAALEPIAGKDAVRSTATHYALAPGLRVLFCRAVRRLGIGAFRGRGAGRDVVDYARRHRLSTAQAAWELALHAAESG